MTTHQVAETDELTAYDTCAKCGLAIQDDVYGRGLVTMLTGNAKCYGRQP